MAMSTAINAPEDFVLSKSISGTKFVKALKRVLLDSFGQTDSASLKEDLADALDIEVEDIPTQCSNSSDGRKDHDIRLRS
jgi:hypothetical protein